MNYQSYYESPLGLIQLQCTERGLTSVQFCDLETPSPEKGKEETSTKLHPHLAKAKAQLQDYFSGKELLETITIDPSIGTPFQQAVWREVSKIPRGETSTYGTIAQILNRPNAARAVGAANGKNPFTILVPCHRLLGASGKLHGYVGGIERKRHLLAFENVGSIP
ncbi:MAG: methylated-DNA--[protein]-cysteine S-methyltransferase [Bacteroidota bacterium]